MLEVVLCHGLHDYRAELGEGLVDDEVAVLEPHYTQLLPGLLGLTPYDCSSGTWDCS